MASNQDWSRKAGTVDSALTSVHPYGQVQVTERVALWGVGGYGTGDMTIEQDGASKQDRQRMRMAAAGVRGTHQEAWQELYGSVQY